MRTLAVLGVVWALGLLLVPIAGVAVNAWVAWGFLALTFTIIAVGECLHGTVQAPLVADLADHSLIGLHGRLGVLLGCRVRPRPGRRRARPEPLAARALAGGCRCLPRRRRAALALERSIPAGARTTPKRAQPVLTES